MSDNSSQFNGTGAASATVAGVALLMKRATPEATPDEIRERLKTNDAPGIVVEVEPELPEGYTETSGTSMSMPP